MSPDQNANQLYWANALDGAQLGYQTFLGDPEELLHRYSSAEHFGLACLYYAFIFKACDEPEKFARIKSVTEFLLREAQAQSKYESSYFAHQSAQIFEDGGSFRCQWYSRILKLIDGSEFDGQISVPHQILTSLESSAYAAHSLKNFLNNYAFVWLTFGDWKGFVQVYESYLERNFRGGTRYSRKTKAIYAYCKTMLDGDLAGAKKAIAIHYQQSKRWHDGRGDSSWWQSFLWCYASYRCDGAAEINWLDLKNIPLDLTEASATP